MKNYLIILCVCLLGIGCTKNTEKKISEPILNEPILNNTATEKKVFPVEPPMFFPENKKIIFENNTDLRNYPSFDDDVIYTAQKGDGFLIIGISGENETIDDFEGNWFYLELEKNKDITGWVFSKYVNNFAKEYTPLKFVELIPIQNNRIPLIKLSYTLNGNEVFTEIDYTKWKNYYIIAWGRNMPRFHYTNKPGVYLIDKDTFELTHITYLGSDAFDQHGNTFTDDFEYLFQGGFKDSFTAWRIRDRKEVYSGNGLNIINNHTIQIKYIIASRFNSKWSIDEFVQDEELIAYGLKYLEENETPREMNSSRGPIPVTDTQILDLIILCSYNLDTGERIILEGRYTFGQ
jgi:hypothetical protein